MTSEGMAGQVRAESLLTLNEILESTEGFRVFGDGEVRFTSVQTDSRLVTPLTLFVPLIGNARDGHGYIEEAIQKGSSVVFCARQNYLENIPRYAELCRKYPGVTFIAVESTLKALQNIAERYVEKFPRLIKIGITGSSGKTTTKEILVSILSRRYRVIANEGNLNSETGLPLSVFNIRREHECGVFEMGMNRPEEIAELTAVLKPRFAIITNIGCAHIGIMKSRQRIAEEKARIFTYFNGAGTAVIPADDDFTDFLCSRAEGTVIKVGRETEDIKYVRDLGLDGTELSVGGIKTVLPLPGVYNYRNALLAATLAKALELSNEQISAGIQSVPHLFGRSEVIRGRYTVIQDCYNSNPDSARHAVEEFSRLAPASGAKRILVLGDMLELGDRAAIEHAALAGCAVRSGADLVIFVGNEFAKVRDRIGNKVPGRARNDKGSRNASASTEVRYVAGTLDADMEEIADEVRSFAEMNRGTIILVKGSRALHLERAVKMMLGDSRVNSEMIAEPASGMAVR